MIETFVLIDTALEMSFLSSNLMVKHDPDFVTAESSYNCGSTAGKFYLFKMHYMFFFGDLISAFLQGYPNVDENNNLNRYFFCYFSQSS